MENVLTLTDEQLVALYATGNNEAFDELLRRHQEKLFSYINRIVKDEDVSNDIFQDTFVKAIVTIKQGRYSESGKFSAWLLRIAHNRVIDYFRQEKAENVQSCDDGEVNVLNRKDLCESNVEDKLVSMQTKVDIRRIIKALPMSQREVLIMRYYKNMSFKEIADSTNVSINTALGRMRYAILNMRRIAEQYDIVLTV